MAQPLNAMELISAWNTRQAQQAQAYDEINRNAMLDPYRMQALEANALRAREAPVQQRNALAFQREQAGERNALAREQIGSRERMGMNAMAVRDRAAQAAASRGPAAPAGYRWTKDGNMEAIPGGPASIKVDKKDDELSRTIKTYEEARDGLLKGLDGTVSGPFLGRMPALSANQQVADGGVAAMAPVLKQIFRTAGEGTFSDKDQEILLAMIPTRADRPDARSRKLENIDRIISAKFGKQVRSLSGDGAKQESTLPGETKPIVSDGWSIKKL